MSIETTKVVCVTCPVGCQIEVDHDGDRIIEVRGNSCPRGYKYASAEATHPERLLTSTVKISGGNVERLPVRSVSPLPREKLLECMAEIKKTSVMSPIKTGDIIIKNIAGTGIDIVAARDM